ncbi:unnamed protein product [Urochloa decumbens]|uniref:Late embryogenesis abundant protein LEA-2 subgroup domain-containing protein n=1 Tax=Urochloa decumbens TaxID=240449 RepID=A0ABC9BYJ7_9POAL
MLAALKKSARSWTVFKATAFCVALLFIVCFLRGIHTANPWDNNFFRAYVDSAVLADLDSATSSYPNSTSSLRYDMSVNITLKDRRNWLMRHGGFWFRGSAVTAFYNGTMLGVPDKWASARSSGDGPMKQARPSSRFQGTVAVYSSVAAELERERAAGTVHVRVRLSAALVSRLAFMPIQKFFTYRSYDCWLWFPPPHQGAPSVFDAGTRCWQAK